MTKEALTLAIDVAINAMKDATKSIDKLSAENRTLKEALAQPEQEPVAWYHPENDRTYFTAYPDKNMIKNGYWQPLYKKGKL